MLQARGTGGTRPRSHRRATPQESPQDIVRRLQRLPPNKKCADCSAKLPQVVNLTHGTFVCLACSGVHREFNHRVKGIGHSSFTQEEVSKLQQASSGNEASNSRFLAAYDATRERLKAPQNSSDQQLLRVWIRRKYIDKAWYRGGDEEESTQQPPGTSATRVAIPPKKKKSSAAPAPAPAVAESVDLFSFDAAPAPAPTPAAGQDEWDAFGSQRSQQQEPQTASQQQPSFAANFDQMPSNSGQDFPQQQQQPTQSQFAADFGQMQNSAGPSLQQPQQSGPTQPSQAQSNFTANFDQMPTPGQSFQQQGVQPEQHSPFAADFGQIQNNGAANQAPQQGTQLQQQQNAQFSSNFDQTKTGGGQPSQQLQQQGQSAQQQQSQPQGQFATNLGPQQSQGQGGQSFPGHQQQGGQSFPGQQQHGGQSFPGQQQQGGQSFPGHQQQGDQSFPGQQQQGGQSFPGQQMQGGQNFPGQQQQGVQNFPGQQQQGGQNIPGQQMQGGQNFPGQQQQGVQNFPGQQQQGGQNFPGRQQQGGQNFPGQQQQGGQNFPGQQGQAPSGQQNQAVSGHQQQEGQSATGQQQQNVHPPPPATEISGQEQNTPIEQRPAQPQQSQQVSDNQSSQQQMMATTQQEQTPSQQHPSMNGPMPAQNESQMQSGGDGQPTGTTIAPMYSSSSENAFDAFADLALGPSTNVNSSAKEGVGTDDASGTNPDAVQGLSSSAPQSNFYKGQEAMYRSHNNLLKITVLNVHHDDELVPYYTILLPDGNEKQTDDGHLSKVGEEVVDGSSVSSMHMNGEKEEVSTRMNGSMGTVGGYDGGSNSMNHQQMQKEQVWVNSQQRQVLDMVQKLSSQQVEEVHRFIENLISSSPSPSASIQQPPQQQPPPPQHQPAPHQPPSQQPPPPPPQQQGQMQHQDQQQQLMHYPPHQLSTHQAPPANQIQMNQGVGPATGFDKAVNQTSMPQQQQQNMGQGVAPTLPSPPKQKEGNPFDKF